MPNVRSLARMLSRYWRWLAPRPRMPPRCVCTTTSSPPARTARPAPGSRVPARTGARARATWARWPTARTCAVSTASALSTMPGGPSTCSWWPRRRTSTPRRSSTWRRFCSIGPANIAEPGVVGGFERQLAGFDLGVQAMLRSGVATPAAQRVGHRLGDHARRRTGRSGRRRRRNSPSDCSRCGRRAAARPASRAAPPARAARCPPSRG